MSIRPHPDARSSLFLRLPAICLAVLAILAIPPVAGFADQGTDDPQDEEGSARQGDEISVVVTLDAKLPDASAIGPAADRQRTQAVASARAEIADALDDRGARIEREYEHSAQIVVEVAPEDIGEIAQLPGVVEAVPDFTVPLALDPAIDLVGASPAEAAGRTFTGEGTAVAILDTGVAAGHEFFARPGGGHRVVAEACFAEPGNCPHGQEGPGAAAPLVVAGAPNWHGSHVAGIAVGQRDSQGPSHGMAPGADILAVQVFSDIDGTALARYSDILAGLQWVYTQRGTHDVAAINLSLGGMPNGGSNCDTGYATMLGVIDDLLDAGIVTVAASGNSGSRNGVSWPACLSNVVAVGASTQGDDIAGFSNVGPALDLVAPGSSIRSSMLSGYGYASGTSMAAPMVAGALALLREADPDASGRALADAVGTSATLLDDQRSSGTATGLPRLDMPTALEAMGLESKGEPAAPRLTASRGELSTSLSWNAVPAPNGGVMSYQLHRSTGDSCSSSSPRVYSGRATSQTDDGLRHGSTYRYCVYAVEGSSNRSGRSNIERTTARDTTAPPAPSLSSNVQRTQVSLSWSRVSDPTSPITYRLHRSTGSSCSASSPLVYVGTSRSYVDTGLDARTYRYCVSATDGAGNRSGRSNVRSVTPTDPLEGCHAFAGDWNRSGRDGLGWWCAGRVRLRTSSGQTISYHYGRSGDVPIVADWNGDGRDTVSVIRDGTWHVNNQLSGGASSRTFHYGRVTRGDVPIAGDWTRGGRDLPAIVRDREWHLRSSQSGGDATWSFIYGRLTRGDLPLWGDWNGDGRDTVGIVRDGTWHLRNTHAGGAADRSYIYGRVLAGDVPVTGDWNGNGIDTPAIVRDGVWHLKHHHGGGPADRTIAFGSP